MQAAFSKFKLETDLFASMGEEIEEELICDSHKILMPFDTAGNPSGKQSVKERKRKNIRCLSPLRLPPHLSNS